MKFAYLAALFIGIPYGIAATFYYTEWLGWPTLFVGTALWLGVCKQIVDERK